MVEPCHSLYLLVGRLVLVEIAYETHADGVAIAPKGVGPYETHVAPRLRDTITSDDKMISHI